MKLNVIQLAAYLVIIAAGIKAAAPVLNVVFLALLIGTSIVPLLLWLIRKGVPKSVSLLITILLLIFIIGLIGSVISVAAIGLAEKMPEYQERLIAMKDGIGSFMVGWGIDISDILSRQEFETEKIVNFAKEFISGIVSTFSNFALILMLIIFLLIDTADLHYKIFKGEKKISTGLAKRMELRDEIRKYNSISAFTGAITAFGNLILLLIMGLDFALLWSFLSFLFSFIPSVGFILSVIPPAFIALVEMGPTAAIIVIIGFVLINGIVENVIRPRFMGKELQISLTTIFLSLIFWAWLLGPIGAILAIPLTIAVMKAKDIFLQDGLTNNLNM
jgi:predicted PurR-regulated permease PerM